MSIERVTVVDQIEVNRGDAVQVRLALQLVENGEVISTQNHRTGVAYDGPGVDFQFEVVNGHLAQMGWPPLDEPGIAHVRAIYDTAKAARG